MAFQAQDNFTASPDGVPFTVERGQVFPDNHPLVKLDAGRGLLFKRLDLDEPPPSGKAPKPGPAAKAEAEAQAAPAAKAAVAAKPEVAAKPVPGKAGH